MEPNPPVATVLKNLGSAVMRWGCQLVSDGLEATVVEGRPISGFNDGAVSRGSYAVADETDPCS